jgi:hypothetical protein
MPAFAGPFAAAGGMDDSFSAHDLKMQIPQLSAIILRVKRRPRFRVQRCSAALRAPSQKTLRTAMLLKAVDRVAKIKSGRALPHSKTQAFKSRSVHRTHCQSRSFVESAIKLVLADCFGNTRDVT